MKLGRSARIALREARGLVWSPSGGLILGTFWALTGWIFTLMLFRFQELLLQSARAGGIRTAPSALHVNDLVIADLLGVTGQLVLVCFVPALTMRSFAEERRTGNLELLMSQPVTGAELLLGKVAGSYLALLACLAVFVPYGIILGAVTAPDWPAALVGLLGLCLLGLLFVALGTLVSVLTRSPVEAFVLSLGLLLLVMVGPGLVAGSVAWLRPAAEFLSIDARLQLFASGVFDPAQVAFFLGATFLLLAVSLRGLDLVRWQG